MQQAAAKSLQTEKASLNESPLKISPVGVRLPDGNIRIMKHARLLPFYYLIPEEILSKCGSELNSIPRIFNALLRDPATIDIVESDLFMLCIMDCYAYMVWPYLRPDIPYMEIFSVNEPSWRLAHAHHIWINEIHRLDLIPTFEEYCMNKSIYIPYAPIEVVSYIISTAVTSAVERYDLQPIIDVAAEFRCFEDFDGRKSNQKIDLYRKWYHTRSKKAEYSLEGYKEHLMEVYDDDGWEVPDPLSSFEDEIIEKVDVDRFLRTLDDKDKQILLMRAEGYTLQEMSDKLGFKTHSAVLKRINKLGRKYEDFTGLSFGFQRMT